MNFFLNILDCSVLSSGILRLLELLPSDGLLTTCDFLLGKLKLQGSWKTIFTSIFVEL